MKAKLRLGIVGAGSVVREIYQHLYFQSRYSSQFEICGVADPNDVSRDWFGDLAHLPQNRRFAHYEDLLKHVELDAVQVNTPDHLHCAPAVAALKAGLDVVLPKPLAATVKDADLLIETAGQMGRFLGVDFHKREDPRIREATARVHSGRYGTFQAAVFYMLDRLSVADPNHSPRFFTSPDFAAKNTPVSFLAVHMADALLTMVDVRPLRVRANGYSQKLPSLKPISVDGYDLVDTEIEFATGAVAHIITGWALPNTAWSLTVQSGRLICSDGLIDLSLDNPGFREVTPDSLTEVNPLFRNFAKDGLVTGYGIDNPGRLYGQMLADRNGSLSPAERCNALSPSNLGFYTTLVLEAAERSLAEGIRLKTGATLGNSVNLADFLAAQLGSNRARRYGLPAGRNVE